VFDSFYEFLQSIGYPHPIHPAETHLPIGTIVAAFFFAWTAFLFHRPRLALTARHCIIFAFIFIFPTILFGFMDWQHFLGGLRLFPIKVKLPLTFLLLIILGIAIVQGFFILAREQPLAKSKPLLSLYTLAFIIVVIIGYFGGNLVYGGRSPVPAREFLAGGKIFHLKCSGCHPRGGNIISPNLPIRGAPQLKDFDTFVGFIRHPLLPNGSKGVMPEFSEKNLSGEKARELYQYIMNVLEKPGRG
jgi:uncharacterized membrane protein